MLDHPEASVTAIGRFYLPAKQQRNLLQHVRETRSRFPRYSDIEILDFMTENYGWCDFTAEILQAFSRNYTWTAREVQILLKARTNGRTIQFIKENYFPHWSTGNLASNLSKLYERYPSMNIDQILDAMIREQGDLTSGIAKTNLVYTHRGL